MASFKFLVQLPLPIAILWLGERGKELLDAKISSHEPLSVINGCTDELTYIPSDNMNTEFDEAQSMQYAIVVMTVIMLVATGLELCSIFVLIYSKMQKRKVERENSDQRQ